MIEDWTTAPIAEGTRATLGYLRKVTLRPEQVCPADARAVLDAGVSERALVEALQVCALFNLIDRVADALDFHVVSRESFAKSTKVLLSRGYR